MKSRETGETEPNLHNQLKCTGLAEKCLGEISKRQYLLNSTNDGNLGEP